MKHTIRFAFDMQPRNIDLVMNDIETFISGIEGKITIGYTLYVHPVAGGIAIGDVDIPTYQPLMTTTSNIFGMFGKDTLIDMINNMNEYQYRCLRSDGITITYNE